MDNQNTPETQIVELLAAVSRLERGFKEMNNKVAPMVKAFINLGNRVTELVAALEREEAEPAEEPVVEPQPEEDSE